MPAVEASELQAPTVEVKDRADEGPAVLQEGDFPVLGSGRRSSEALSEAASSSQWDKSLPFVSEAKASKKQRSSTAAQGESNGVLQVGTTLNFGIRGSLERDASPQVGEVSHMPPTGAGFRPQVSVPGFICHHSPWSLVPPVLDADWRPGPLSRRCQC